MLILSTALHSLILTSPGISLVVLSHGHGIPARINSSPLLRMSLSNGRILMMKSKRILKVKRATREIKEILVKRGVMVPMVPMVLMVRTVHLLSGKVALLLTLLILRMVGRIRIRLMARAMSIRMAHGIK